MNLLWFTIAALNHNNSADQEPVFLFPKNHRRNIGSAFRCDITVPAMTVESTIPAGSAVTQKARHYISTKRTRSHLQVSQIYLLALSLFVFWVLTDHSDTTLSFNDFAFFANRFYWWSYFHSNTLLSKKSAYKYNIWFFKLQAVSTKNWTSQLFVTPNNSSLC